MITARSNIVSCVDRQPAVWKRRPSPEALWLLIGIGRSTLDRCPQGSGHIVGDPEAENSSPQLCAVSDKRRLVCEVGKVESEPLQIILLPDVLDAFQLAF